MIPKSAHLPNIISPHDLDFMVQNVEAGIGNFDKILKIMTLYLLLLTKSPY